MIFSIYVLGIVLAVATGKLLRRVLFAKSVSPFVMELPPYRMPTVKGTVIHVWERTSLFLTKAGTIILAASVITLLVTIYSFRSMAGHDREPVFYAYLLFCFSH